MRRHPVPRPADPDCMHVRCARPATSWLVPTYGVRTPWCGRHVKAAEAAGYLGSDHRGERVPVYRRRRR